MTTSLLLAKKAPEPEQSIQRPIRKSFIRLLVIGLSLILLLSGSGPLNGQDKKGDKDLLKQKGPIQEISKPLSELMDLNWKDGRLIFRIKDSYEKIDPIVDQIRQVVGWGGGSSSHGGSNGFSFEIKAEKINGHIKREKSKKVSTTSVTFTETVKPFRSFSASITDEGLLQITINASQSVYILRIRQSADGRFMVQELNGTDVFAGVSADFDSFCRDYRQYTSQRLLPTLKHFGFGQVLTPYNAEIQNRVAELVSPWDEQELAKARDLTNALDSALYEERVAAAEQLEKQYKGNEAILARLVHDHQFHPEARARARKLIREKADDDKLVELDFVDGIAASLDASYLMDLIQLQTDPERQRVLIDRLRSLDPEFADADMSDKEVVSLVATRTKNAWTNSQDGNEFGIEVLKEKGHLQEISVNTGQLARLIWIDDGLCIDRDHWMEPFAGRSISDISKEVSDLVKKNNLPEDWFKAGGSAYTSTSAQHPQVLFENLQGKCGGSKSQVGSYSTYGGRHPGANTPNRQFDLEKLKGELTFDRKARNRRGIRVGGSSSSKKKANQPFVLTLTEKSGPQRTLLIDEAKPGQLRLMIVGESSNYIVQLILNKDQAIVQDIRGSKVVAYKAKSFRELQKQNRDYFNKSFFPLFRHLGVQIDPNVDGGPDGNETTMHPDQDGFDTNVADN